MMSDAKQQHETIFTTEFATIGLRFDGDRLTGLDYLNRKQDKQPSSRSVASVKSKIEKYLAPGSKLKMIKVDMSLNVTPFQQKVLDQLQAIPYGETRTYGEIAKALNTSARAVGNACRNNPVPIIIPCHRVVSAKGIGGYDGAKSGGRLTIKSKLLEMEGVSFS